MTTLDREALVAHIRACANGTDLLQDGAFQMSARRTIRKALNDAADALSSLPAQAVGVKALEWKSRYPLPWSYDDYNGDYLDAGGHLVDLGDDDTVASIIRAVNALRSTP